MLALFKRKTIEEEREEVMAKEAYAKILHAVRLPVFYKKYNVADTQEARFDLMLLHAFTIMHVTKDDPAGKTFNQALFDAMFADMDQSLRAIGIGDMGVPKRMRRMMKAFNGRMHVYEEASSSAAKLEEAIARNLYAGVDVPKAKLTAMLKYVQDHIKTFGKMPMDDLMNAKFDFRHPV